MIKKVTIYGERCSGTNYLEQLLVNNFDVTVTWEYGWKHFFGFNDLGNSDDTLFIGIVRNPYDWINSLYREQHHLPKHFKGNINNFLNSEFYSLDDSKREIIKDRNIYTKKRYKNVFEMRHTKLKFLIEDMPKLVKNYILITYEKLMDEFNLTINEIRNMGLTIKKGVHRPLNVHYYKKSTKVKFEINQKTNNISKERIIDKMNMYYEELLKYKL